MNQLHDFLKKRIEDTKGFMDYLPIEVMEIREGYVKAKLTASEKLCNPFGTLHGGCLFSAADSVAGTAAMTHGNYVTTTCGNIHYLNPAEKTARLWITASEIKAGRKLFTYDVVVTDDVGAIVCKATMEYYTLRKIEIV